jgi:dienelactone hydrolase
MKTELEVRIAARDATLDGNLTVPAGARGLVLFVHGSGSSRHSPRNRFVARTLNDAGLGTLLFDLLTRDEEAVDARTAHLRFDIDLLARRLGAASDWVSGEPGLNELRIGYFGSSTGGGAALVAAAAHPGKAGAVVSRGGRPDLAGPALASVEAPTLLVVGGEDEIVIDLNRQAMARMRCEVKLEIVPGATHLFEEPGALETVAGLARDWFLQHLSRSSRRGAPPAA